MIAIELNAAINAAGAEQTFYVSDAAFVTSPNDLPPNTAFDESVIDPGSIGLHAFSDGRTGGATRLEVGEIVLANLNGQYDAWAGYSFDGRQVVVRVGDGGSYPDSFTPLMVGTADGVVVTMRQVVVRLRDAQFIFQQPVRAAALYGGSNALPDGLDGLPGDLKGKARPVAYGKVFNVSPPQVNTSRLIFETGVCNSVDAVYSNGVALTAGAAYTSQSDMETNAPAAGQFRAWPAGGYFRLGSYSAEQVTADVTQGASAADRTVAQLIRALSLAAGLVSDQISAADVAALDAANSSVAGIWIDDAGVTFSSAMDQLAASVGAFYCVDANGVLRMGRLTEPVGVPALTIHEYEILNGFERRPPRDNGLPVWSVTVNHTKVWTAQTSGLAGAAAARAGFVGQERRAVNRADASVKTQFKLAGVLAVDTLLTDEAAAATEAARLLDIYKVPRGIFDVPVPISVLKGVALNIGDIVEVQHPRFGMAAGRQFRYIGPAFNLAKQVATLSVWG